MLSNTNDYIVILLLLLIFGAVVAFVFAQKLNLSLPSFLPSFITSSSLATPALENLYPFQDLISSSKKVDRNSITSFFWALLPSFITYQFEGESAESPAGPWTPTSWLDGLRGVAAWIVFNAHVSPVLPPWLPTTADQFAFTQIVRPLDKQIDPGWGHEGDNQHIWQLPFIKALYSGTIAVAIFFVISGFALSISACRRMNQIPRDQAGFMKSLGSSVLRRPFRLYLPGWISTIFVFAFMRLGPMGIIMSILGDERVFRGWGSSPVDAANFEIPFWTSFSLLYHENIRMLHIFRESDMLDFDNDFNPALWTIPIEFRASLMLFLCHIATFNMSRKYRLWSLLGMILLSVICDNFDILLFWAGFMLAEWNEIAPPTKPAAEPSRRSTALMAAGLVVAVFVGALPEWEPEFTPGYRWMGYVTPVTYTNLPRFWAAVGAIVIVAICGRLPAVAAFLSSAPIRYLGRISFAFYLVHLFCITAVGFPVLWLTWVAWGRDTPVGGPLGFFVSYSILTVFTIWMADIFWRFVDIPIVKLGKWIEKKMFV